MNDEHRDFLFRSDELPVDLPMPGVERRRLIGDQAMISLLTLARGTVVPEHSHPNEQFACVLTGELRFAIRDGMHSRTEIALAGDIVHLPGDVPHAVEVLADATVLDVFAPPSEGTGLDQGLESPTPPGEEAPDDH